MINVWPTFVRGANAFGRPLGLCVDDVMALGCGVIHRLPSSAACLTFDDGPTPYSTPILLEVLRSPRVRATFCIGANAAHYPDLIHKIIDEGHEVANHTMTRPNLQTLSPSRLRREMIECSTMLSAC